ncbi:MAG: spore maturation protein A [Clostridiales bacterium]|nr:spore maturation protein A [Clostridiales bacterium]
MAMSIIWLMLLLLATLTGLLTGSTQAVGAAALSGAQSAVTLVFSMAGAICLWSALAKLMDASGLMQKLTRLLRPALRRLFPDAAADERTMGFLCANLSANLLGLGNAATPMGINAVRRMQAVSGTAEATDDMCLLIVMNSASVQLIPSTVAALRASLGAASAFDILPAVWLASSVSVTSGILAARLLRRWWRR